MSDCPCVCLACEQPFDNGVAGARHVRTDHADLLGSHRVPAEFLHFTRPVEVQPEEDGKRIGPFVCRHCLWVSEMPGEGVIRTHVETQHLTREIEEWSKAPFNGKEGLVKKKVSDPAVYRRDYVTRADLGLEIAMKREGDEVAVERFGSQVQWVDTVADFLNECERGEPPEVERL